MKNEPKVPEVLQPCAECNTLAWDSLNASMEKQSDAPVHIGDSFCTHHHVATIYTQYADGRLFVSMNWGCTQMEATECIRGGEHNSVTAH